MNNWKNKKWLVVSWRIIFFFTVLLVIITPSFLTFVLLILTGIGALASNFLYKSANNTSNVSKDAKKDNTQNFQPTNDFNAVPVAATLSNEISRSPKVKHDYFTFNVAGVTMKNDDNKDIQKLLKRCGKLYCEENFIELYSGYTNKEILEDFNEVTEFEDVEFGEEEISFIPEPTNKYDKNAIKVFIDFGNEGLQHVGYVPKIHTEIIRTILDEQEVINLSARFVGGKVKEIEYNYEKDKDVVITRELTLGIEIEIKYKNK